MFCVNIRVSVARHPAASLSAHFIRNLVWHKGLTDDWQEKTERMHGDRRAERFFRRAEKLTGHDLWMK
jgi:hypothetical protein